MAGKPGWKHTPEARAKIAAAKRGKPRPDVADRNRSPEMRAIPRVMSEEARLRIAADRTVHGHARSRAEGRGGTRTYYVWAAMIQRCTNPNNDDWYLYGGRGITVCERWRGSFGNCKWATWLEQRHNQRPRRSVKAAP